MVAGDRLYFEQQPKLEEEEEEEEGEEEEGEEEEECLFSKVLTEF